MEMALYGIVGQTCWVTLITPVAVSVKFVGMCIWMTAGAGALKNMKEKMCWPLWYMSSDIALGLPILIVGKQLCFIPAVFGENV